MGCHQAGDSHQVDPAVRLCFLSSWYATRIIGLGIETRCGEPLNRPIKLFEAFYQPRHFQHSIGEVDTESRVIADIIRIHVCKTVSAPSSEMERA